MNIVQCKTGLAAAAVSLALIGAPAAIAAEGAAQGETSGPAAGTHVTPGGAVQKQASTESGTTAGAPGVEGKQGAESGSAPSTPKSKTGANSQ